MLVTPFHDDYRLNEAALRKEVQWAIASGAQGVVAAPSIGEFLHMNEAERARVFEIVVEEARKHPNVSTVAMTSGATTLETLHYAKIAARLGYDAQQVIPPYYWRCGEAEVERHYRMIAEAGDLPVVIYHNPALSKFNISPKFRGETRDDRGRRGIQGSADRFAASRGALRRSGRPRRYLQYVSRDAGRVDARSGRAASSTFSRCRRRSH